MTIGRWMRLRRERLGWSQLAVAKAMRVHQTRISRMELDQSPPTLYELAEFCKQTGAKWPEAYQILVGTYG